MDQSEDSAGNPHSGERPMQINIKRVNQAVHLEARNEEGNLVAIDGSPAIGGEGLGMRPMQLVLVALGTCSSMDVLSILKKQKQTPVSFEVEVTGEREEGQVPSVFTDIHVKFKITGPLDPNKIERAIELSIETYCSVSRMLEKTAKITSSYTLNEN